MYEYTGYILWTADRQPLVIGNAKKLNIFDIHLALFNNG